MRAPGGDDDEVPAVHRERLAAVLDFPGEASAEDVVDLQPFVGIPGDAVRLAVVDESEPPDERQVETDALDVCHTWIIP